MNWLVWCKLERPYMGEMEFKPRGCFIERYQAQSEWHQKVEDVLIAALVQSSVFVAILLFPFFVWGASFVLFLG